MTLSLLKRFFTHNGGVALIEFAMVFPVLFLLIFGGIEINRLILIQQKLEKAGYVMADIVTQYQPATTFKAAGEISTEQLKNNVFPQLARMMGTYSDPANQSAIITSLRVKGPTAGRTITIDWQMGSGIQTTVCDALSPQNCAQSIVNNVTAANTITPAQRDATATFGTTADGAAIKSKIMALPQQVGATDYTVIVNEVFYYYKPLLGTLVEDVGAAGGNGFGGYKFYLKPRIFVKRTFFIPRLESKLFDLPNPITPSTGFPVR